MKKCLFFLLLPTALLAQNTVNNAEIYRLHIGATSESITVDGELSELVWQQAEVAADFQLNAPVDEQPASKRTEVRMAYNEHYIYVAATCFDDPKLFIETLKRDSYGESDEFAILLDPVCQRANGYGFGVNAMGAQSEVLLGGDDGDDADESWDNRWFVEVRRMEDRWTLEMAIPFKTLRYKEDLSEWRVNFIRTEPGANEMHCWAAVPRQFEIGDLGYFGTLVWDKAPPKTGSNISFIPYVTSSVHQDFSSDKPTTGDWNIGGDAKIAITPTLNLDLTLNPDFSQVDVDEQVTNLSRFDIFFPERRQFFIENADVFINSGEFNDQPFFSRRIGLDENGQTVPILYGARLTGNLTDKLRMGAFNMHARGNDVRLGQNYSALTFQQRLWARSSVKGIFLNRQSFEGSEAVRDDYGRNVGGDFSLNTPDGKWQAVAGYMHSLKKGFSDRNSQIYGRLAYSGTRFRTFLEMQHMGENYFADMGFNPRIENYNPETDEVVRVGFTQFSNMVDYYTYPNKGRVNYYWAGLENFAWINPDGTLNEWYTRLRYFIFFKNTSQLRFRLNNNYVDLLFPFALTSTPLPATAYNMTEFNVQFNTDTRRNLSTEWFVVYGEFYNGTKLTYEGSVKLRVQPWGNFSVGVEQNDIWLPEPYGRLHLTLASARAEINFSTRLFWTTFLQYNTQADNFNVNSRLQWRFAPMSDLFLVYTDNYRVEGIFGPKNRTLTLKLNYWLTL